MPHIFFPRFIFAILILAAALFSDSYGAGINPLLNDKAGLFEVAADVEQSPLNREIAEKLLVASGADIIPLLHAKLSNPDDRSVSVQVALRLLGKVCSIKDESLLLSFCEHENIFIRDKALAALTNTYSRQELEKIVSRQTLSYEKSGEAGGVTELPAPDISRSFAAWKALALAAEERDETFSLEKMLGADFGASGPDGFVAAIEAMPDASLRQAVVGALAFCHEREFAAAVLAAMLAGDPAPTVRAASAHALGLLPVQNMQVLVNALEDDNDIVRLEAAAAMVRWGATEEGLEILHNVLLSADKVVTEKLKTAQALLDEAVGGNIHTIGGGAGLRRLHALNLLEELAQPQSESPLVTLLGSSQWRIRAEAARIIGLLQGSGITHELQAILEDPHPAVRAEAAIALSRQGAMGVQWRVAKWLEHPTPLFRAEAARALGQIRPSGLLVELARLISDDSLSVAVAATAALGNFRNEKEEVTPLLYAALADQRLAVAGTAVLELSQLTGKDVESLLSRQ